MDIKDLYLYLYRYNGILSSSKPKEDDKGKVAQEPRASHQEQDLGISGGEAFTGRRYGAGEDVLRERWSPFSGDGNAKVHLLQELTAPTTS